MGNISFSASRSNGKELEGLGLGFFVRAELTSGRYFYIVSKL